MRIFVALDIDEVIRKRIQLFLDGVRGFAPDARWVRSESLHVTLKFIGNKPAVEVDAIRKAVARIRADIVDIKFRGYGFFPTPTAARVFWLGVDADSRLALLAKSVDDITTTVGVPAEEHAFNPHLTLARRGGGPGTPRRQKSDGSNQVFQRLQERLGALPVPEFGTMTAREFFVYESQLGRGGSRYTKIARFELK
jgi:RNA 2',3'-cyclic 3'-phosphodiesterase